jgi:pimeloyl-ACP methyl ester carboxylesterase
MGLGKSLEAIKRQLQVKYIQLLQSVSEELAVKKALEGFGKPLRYRRPHREEELIPKGERHVFRSGLVAYRFGTGPAVLLVHGWSGRGTQLGAFIDPLLAAGYSVYALDGPGHGESPGSETNPMHFALHLRTISQELKGLAGVIAHSFGAGASAIAAKEGLQTKSLVLIGGPNDYVKVLDNYTNRLRLNKRSKDLFLQHMALRTALPPLSSRISQIAELKSIATLVVHDRDDREVSIKDAEELVTSLQLEHLFTEGLGHYRILRSHRVIEKIVQFIAKHARARASEEAQHS